MLNSLTVLIAFLGFLIFGYASLVRILFKQQFTAPWRALSQNLFAAQGLQHIGSSAFFVSLPATSLLLFWGWAPALLWLVIFHLLADSLVNLQVTAVEHESALSEYLLGNSGSTRSLLMRALIQIYLVLLLAIVLSMLAQLLDKQSGLLFALIALLPALKLLRNENPTIPALLKKIGAVLLLGIGFVFANELGFALYGDWAPVDSVLGEGTADWFRFNNTTIIAMILLTGGAALASHERFSNDVSVMAGVIVIATIIILMFKLAWVQPILDAPLNRTNLAGNHDDIVGPPAFMGLGLFLFAGLTTLFFRVFNSTAPAEEELEPAADFGRVQAESLLQLLLAVMLVICLAAALGIGAWKTHYLDWHTQNDFIAQLNLAITSMLSLIHSGATAGNLMHTVIMAGLCIAGLSFLRVCIKALALFEETDEPTADNPTLLDTVYTSKLLQLLTSFLVCSYLLVRGVPIEVWILMGILSWLIVMQLIISMTVAMQAHSLARTVYGCQCLILVGLGFAQCIYLMIYWYSSDQLMFSFITLVMFVIGLCLWSSSLIQLCRRFRVSEEQNIF